MSTFEERIPGWRQTLTTVVGQDGTRMTGEQVNIALALVEMLHNSDLAWENIDTCDALIAGFAVEITTNGVRNINQVMINMANTAQAPIADNLTLKVEWYRKAFLYLLATGVSFAALQAMAPGAISFVLDSAYALFLALIAQGIPAETIATEVANNPSPFSAGAFIAQAATAAANAGFYLISSAFYACSYVAGTCARMGLVAASLAANEIPDCLKYGSQLLAFALATKLASKTATAAANMAQRTYALATGSADQAIADWIRSGGPQQVQASIASAAQNFVSSTKTAVIDAFQGIYEVNNNMGDPTIPPNRFAAAHVNDVILHWLEYYISNFQEDWPVHLGKLMSTLAMIDFEADERTKQQLIQGLAQELRTDPHDPRFIALITAYTLATDKQKIQRSVSERRVGYRPPKINKIKKNALNRSRSIPIDRREPVNANDPTAVLFVSNPVARAGPQIPVSPRAIAVNAVDSQIKVIGPLKEKLREVGILRARFPDGSFFGNQSLYMVVGNYPSDVQKQIIKIINKTKTKNSTDLSSRATDKANKDNEDAYLAEIENYLMGLPRPPRSNLGGRSKSRRHKKKQSTLKRRGLKRRRTRKGKKRRHTRKH